MNLLKNFLDKEVKYLIVCSTIWWIVLFGVGIIAEKVLPFTRSFSLYLLEDKATLPTWIEKWSNFDGGAYFTISEFGYKSSRLIQAYFPGYPLLLKITFDSTEFITKPLGINDANKRFVSALIINYVLSTLFFVLLSIYLKPRYDLKTRFWIFVTLFLFPTSFYLHANYTEPFFLVLLVGSLIAYDKKYWKTLTLSLFLLSATRVVGGFLIPGLILDLYFRQNNSQTISLANIKKFVLKNLYPIILIGLGISGLICYMIFLYIEFNDPLLFFHVQAHFGAGRQQSLVLFPQVVWRYIKIIWTVWPFDWKYYAYVQEFITSMIFLGLLIYSVLRRKTYKLGIAELIFTLGAFFLPPLTGNFSSMPRYVLVCIPIFILLGQLLYRYKLARIVFVLVGIFLSVMNIMLFIQGHWVA